MGYRRFEGFGFGFRVLEGLGFGFRAQGCEARTKFRITGFLGFELRLLSLDLGSALGLLPFRG